ncbi:MAG TPA: hypothetical protein VFQ43_13365 [Nitrososphaera sp.]|nr:hypothetical protein [Nitrososphaera sp.]
MASNLERERGKDVLKIVHFFVYQKGIGLIRGIQQEFLVELGYDD